MPFHWSPEVSADRARLPLATVHSRRLTTRARGSLFLLSPWRSNARYYGCSPRIWHLSRAAHGTDSLDLDCYRVAFAAFGKPSRESFGKTFGCYAITSFKRAVACRQGVVKLRRIREVPHAETVEPVERAQLTVARDHYGYPEFLRVHRSSIAKRQTAAGNRSEVRDGGRKMKQALKSWRTCDQSSRHSMFVIFLRFLHV